MKRLGIIGGLGIATTAEFYLEISKGFQKRKISSTPPLLIGSVSAPLAVYDDCIIKNECRFLPYLLSEAKRLEQAESDFLVMPCNTLHRYIQEIREAVNIPVISIVDETIRCIKKSGCKTVGFISTMATVKNKVYEKGFVENGIDYVTVSEAQQSRLNQIIIHLVNDVYLDSDREMLQSVIDGFKAQGITTLVLACTDLQLLRPHGDGVTILDTMRILAEASVDQMLN